FNENNRSLRQQSAVVMGIALLNPSYKDALLHADAFLVGPPYRLADPLYLHDLRRRLERAMAVAVFDDGASLGRADAVQRLGQHLGISAVYIDAARGLRIGLRLCRRPPYQRGIIQ